MSKKKYKQTEEHIKKASDARKIFTKEQEVQIIKGYVEDKLSTYILAEKYHCGSTTILGVLIRNDIKTRSKSEARKGKHFSEEHKRKMCKFSLEVELQIIEGYKSGKSTYELAKMYNCHVWIIWNTLRRNNIKRRTISDALKGKYVGEKHPNFGNDNPEFIHQALKNGFGIKCYYKGEFFPSLVERNCFIKFEERGFKVIHNFLDRFDFLLILPNGEKVVVEYHQFTYKKDLDYNGRTEKEYYNQRRKLLDEKGYKDLKLVVIKNLKEIWKIC